MDMDFFLKLYGDLPKQGPGSDASTLKALRAIPGHQDLETILDVGCGTGRHTMLLARNTPARITALEYIDQQIETLRRNVESAGLSDRIEIVKGSMDDLSFASSKYDLIWSESSIYNIGFERGLRCWKDYLKDGGSIAVSEAVWLVDDPEKEILDYWREQYPGIGTVDSKLRTIKDCGYETIDHFTLPKSDWLDDFYDILSPRLTEYDSKEVSAGALEILAESKLEIEMFERYSDQYGYAFFIMRKAS